MKPAKVLPLRSQIPDPGEAFAAALGGFVRSIVAEAVAEALEGQQTSAAAVGRKLTIDELAERYGISPRTVRREVARGLPHLLVGGRPRFDPAEVDAYYAAQRPGAR
jgi:excisionase family DNA binding protein